MWAAAGQAGLVCQQRTSARASPSLPLKGWSAASRAILEILDLYFPWLSCSVSDPNLKLVTVFFPIKSAVFPTHLGSGIPGLQ